MNNYKRLPAAAIASIAALFVSTLLPSCGGGGVGSGGTGTEPIGVASGTVNGFGSVIVDGVSYDDRRAAAVSDTSPGRTEAVEVKLGHRVTVNYVDSGAATLVHVDIAVRGPVTALAAGALSVLGQTISINASGAVGPITQFGNGYTSAADIRPGDAIDVHGIIVPQGGSYFIQATRIDKLAAPPAFLIVTGIVTAPTGGATPTFTIGLLGVGTASGVILPAGAGLIAGQTVNVLAPWSSLSLDAGGSVSVQAAQVLIRNLPRTELDAFLSGTVSLFDAAAKTFVLDGRIVRYPGATLTPASAVLRDGLYVQARGTVASDGSLVAAAIVVRDAGSESEGELRGDITNFDAASSQFMVRDVSVSAIGATLQGCTGTGLANGLFVDVSGSITSTGVLARTVTCGSESSSSTVAREGRASSVDSAAKTFTLTSGSGTIRVVWSDTTFFGEVTPATLEGQSVQVEGSFLAGTLTATKIKRDD